MVYGLRLAVYGVKFTVNSGQLTVNRTSHPNTAITLKAESPKLQNHFLVNNPTRILGSSVTINRIFSW